MSLTSSLIAAAGSGVPAAFALASMSDQMPAKAAASAVPLGVVTLGLTIERLVAESKEPPLTRSAQSAA